MRDEKRRSPKFHPSSKTNFNTQRTNEHLIKKNCQRRIKPNTFIPLWWDFTDDSIHDQTTKSWDPCKPILSKSHACSFQMQIDKLSQEKIGSHGPIPPMLQLLVMGNSSRVCCGWQWGSKSHPIFNVMSRSLYLGRPRAFHEQSFLWESNVWDDLHSLQVATNRFFGDNEWPFFCFHKHTSHSSNNDVLVLAGWMRLDVRSFDTGMSFNDSQVILYNVAPFEMDWSWTCRKTSF